MHTDIGPLISFLPLVIIWWCFFIFFMLVYRTLLVLLVCRDTIRRKTNTILWGVLVGVFGTMAVIPYLLIREDIKKEKPIEVIGNGKEGI